MKKFKKILLSSICVGSVALAAIPVAIGLTNTSNVNLSNNNQQTSSKDENVNNQESPSINENVSINFSMNIQNIDEVENIGENQLTSKFKFSFDLEQNDLISYKIFEVQSLFGEVLIEEQNSIEVKSSSYEFIKSFDKYVSQKDTKYKIYVEVKRGKTSKTKEASFTVKPRTTNTNVKTISTNILTDTNKMSNFLRLNGGFTFENVKRINNLPLSMKLLYLNGTFIENQNYNKLFAEFENINLDFAGTDGNAIRLSVSYLTREDYTLSNGTRLDQKFFDLQKN